MIGGCARARAVLRLPTRAARGPAGPRNAGRCLTLARVGPSRPCYSSDVAAIRIHTVLSSTTFNLPELAPLVGHRVELTIREESERDWPEGWFEAIEGAIEDPTFERAPQPELEWRALSEP
jgi:hypothetical protein